MSPEAIRIASDIAVIAQALIAFFAAWFAYATITSTRNENKKWNTLNICAQYELNENICKANEGVHIAFQKKVPTQQECIGLQRSAIIVLNYLDGIAIGVNQGLYIEELAKDHMKTIVETQVKRLLESSCKDDLGLDKKDFKFLVEMNESWKQEKTYYRT